MKVIREKGEFKAVIITLETEKELTDVRKAFQLFTKQYTYEWKGRDEMVETFEELLDIEKYE